MTSKGSFQHVIFFFIDDQVSLRCPHGRIFSKKRGEPLTAFVPSSLSIQSSRGKVVRASHFGLAAVGRRPIGTNIPGAKLIFPRYYQGSLDNLGKLKVSRRILKSRILKSGSK